MIFSLEKQLIKFFFKILKKFLEPIQSYEDVPFSGPKRPTCPEQIFFWYKPLLLLSSTYWHFSLCNSGSRVMTMHHFWAQNRSFVPNKYFLGNYWYHSHLPISPFHFAKFKKNSSSGSRVMRMRNFWTQNDPFPKMRIFP